MSNTRAKKALKEALAKILLFRKIIISALLIGIMMHGLKIALRDFLVPGGIQPAIIPT